jgi:predicted aldo/keto reductase-like oxidoreductase
MEDKMTHDSGLTRRKFISSSITGLAAAGFMGISPDAVLAQVKKEKGEIIHRTLGNTGIRLPVVSMGVMNSNNPEVVRASYKHGVRHFDTASRYQYGRNEQMVGDVINRLGVRDKVIISTKEVVNPGGADNIESTVRDLKKQTEGSLRRLNTDYVDILYIHSASSAEDVNDIGILEGLKVLKKEGKIRFSGVSTHQSMTEVINEIASERLYDVILTAFNVTMADDTDLLKAIETAASKGIGIIAMKTQAGGRNLPNRDSLHEYDNSTIATATLKWVLQNPNISTSIPGYTNFAHMTEDFSVAYDLEYTDDEKRLLSDNNLELGFGYCRQCRKCLPTCPKGVDVPNLMRVHMYAAQYGNFQHARMELNDIGKEQSISICGVCTECVAQCSNRVDIKGKIQTLREIYA